MGSSVMVVLPPTAVVVRVLRGISTVTRSLRCLVLVGGLVMWASVCRKMEVLSPIAYVSAVEATRTTRTQMATPSASRTSLARSAKVSALLVLLDVTKCAQSVLLAFSRRHQAIHRVVFIVYAVPASTYRVQERHPKMLSVSGVLKVNSVTA